LNRYPSLKKVIQEIESKRYPNIEIIWVPGMAPTALLYGESGEEVGSVPLQDMGFSELKTLLEKHGFKLEKPKLPPPVFKAEKTIGGKHYRFYSDGQLLYKEAVAFAEGVEHNGEKGRLLTISCKAEDEELVNWITQQVRETTVWLGLNDEDREGTWVWSNGDEMSYSHWSVGEPNNVGDEDCVTWSNKKGWNDVNCEETPATLIIEFGPQKSALCESVLLDVNTVVHDHENIDL